MITAIRRGLGPLLAALMLCSAAARGQSASPVEVSLGYSYLRANAPPGQCGCFNMNGGSGGLAAYLGHGFSAVADVGGYFQSNVVNSGLNLTMETFLFGPRYSYRHSKKWTPFAQFLAGGAHGSGTLYGTSTTATSSNTSAGFTSGSANSFAFSAGGGLDLKASRNVSIRVFQAEYLMTRLPNAVNDYQNDLRLTFGVVLHFGKPRGH
jgi:opacity protein-like surface antigen